MSEQTTESNESAVALVAETAATGAASSLYERQLERYARTMNSGLNEALDRFGLAFFHSLPSGEKILRLKEMGIECADAQDRYNLGLAYASKENYTEAISCWEQSLKSEPGLIEAVLNIAVAYERLGNLGNARTYYKRYAKEISDPEEVQLIENHLSEIGK